MYIYICGPICSIISKINFMYYFHFFAYKFRLEKVLLTKSGVRIFSLSDFLKMCKPEYRFVMLILTQMFLGNIVPSHATSHMTAITVTEHTSPRLIIIHLYLHYVYLKNRNNLKLWILCRSSHRFIALKVRVSVWCKTERLGCRKLD